MDEEVAGIGTVVVPGGGGGGGAGEEVRGTAGGVKGIGGADEVSGMAGGVKMGEVEETVGVVGGGVDETGQVVVVIYVVLIETVSGGLIEEKGWEEPRLST